MGFIFSVRELKGRKTLETGSSGENLKHSRLSQPVRNGFCEA